MPNTKQEFLTLNTNLKYKKAILNIKYKVCSIIMYTDRYGKGDNLQCHKMVLGRSSVVPWMVQWDHLYMYIAVVHGPGRL